jgi:uncharacterized membrane protein YeiH
VACYLLLALALPRPMAAAGGMVTIVLLRLASILWGLRLPVFELRE